MANERRRAQWRKNTLAYVARHPERRKNYRARVITERRRRAILLLGGACVDCGERDERLLQFDHIDPTTKVIEVSCLLDCRPERIVEELLKCALRCVECHMQKSKDDEIRRRIKPEDVPF